MLQETAIERTEGRKFDLQTSVVVFLIYIFGKTDNKKIYNYVISIKLLSKLFVTTLYFFICKISNLNIYFSQFL